MDNDREFEARIGAGEVVFDAEDARLLRAVDEHESLNAATEALGRSFAHAQRRIVALEEAFGTLLERRRGGAGGGGSWGNWAGNSTTWSRPRRGWCQYPGGSSRPRMRPTPMSPSRITGAFANGWRVGRRAKG